MGVTGTVVLLRKREVGEGQKAAEAARESPTAMMIPGSWISCASVIGGELCLRDACWKRTHGAYDAYLPYLSVGSQFFLIYVRIYTYK